MQCEESLELLTDALYTELDQETQQSFDEHLDGCKFCAARYAAMRATLSIMDQHAHRELSQKEWGQYWKTLRARLSSDDQLPSRQQAFRFHPNLAWAYGIAALLVLAVGVYLGRTYFGPKPPVTSAEMAQTAASPGASPDSTTQLALAYLERSKNLLIGIANLSEDHRSIVDLSRPQRISRTLIDQGNVLTVALNKPDQQLLRQLIHDLQVILLQLANMESRPGVPVVEFVKKGIDEKSILLKINLEQMRAGSRSPSTEYSHKRAGKNL